MTDYSIKNIRFDSSKIKDILDNCSQLEKIISEDIEDDTLSYFDVMTGIKYTVVTNESRLEIQSGAYLSGKFEETEYILRVLRALVQNSHVYEKNCTEADNYISSIIGEKISINKYSC
jgi:hypothetical protein